MIANLCTFALFYIVVGRRPQGTLLGWFASAGSIARMTFPILSGYLAHWDGLIVLFYMLAGVLILSTILTMSHKTTLEQLSR